MTLEYVPLLKVQRDLYDLPRGFERFREYMRTMTGGSDELKLPLVAMNPMGKDHLPPFLDHLLAIDADGVGARALAEAASALADESGDYRACLVVSDDLKGGWTNRYADEFSYRFEQRAMYRRAWLPAILWTSETYDVALVREEVLQCVYRVVHVQRHGPPRTLGEMLTQESYVMRSAGSEVSRKIEQYLKSGVQQVWFVEATPRRVTIHTADRTVVVLREDDTLDGGDLLPGFRYSLSRLVDFEFRSTPRRGSL